MPLSPPSDFHPPADRSADEPTNEELRALWDASERRRQERARETEWRRLRDTARRTAADTVVARHGVEALPSYLRDEASFGEHARASLRAAPRSGRVVRAGVDTWSPAWYLPEGCSCRTALESLATIKAGRARMMPGDAAGHRVGWFPESALVFAEGHPALGDLGCADDLPDVLERLELEMGSMGVLVSPSSRAGVRRLDAAVDLATDCRSEGLAILAGVAALTPPGGKVVPWRTGRCVEGVLFKTSRGATRARVYDKGVEAGLAPRGRLIRPEAQCRYPKGSRRDVEELTTDYVRAQFRRRLAPLWDAAQGVKVGGQTALIESAQRWSAGSSARRARGRSSGTYCSRRRTIPKALAGRATSSSVTAGDLASGSAAVTTTMQSIWAPSSKSVSTATRGDGDKGAFRHPAWTEDCHRAHHGHAAIASCLEGSSGLLLVRLVPLRMGSPRGPRRTPNRYLGPERPQPSL